MYNSDRNSFNQVFTIRKTSLTRPANVTVFCSAYKWVQCSKIALYSLDTKRIKGTTHKTVMLTVCQIVILLVFPFKLFTPYFLPRYLKLSNYFPNQTTWNL